MKARLSFTLAGAVLFLTLALSLSTGAAAPAASLPNHAPPPNASSAVLGDYHWSPLGGPVAPGGRVYGLAVHPDLAGTLYAAVSPVGVDNVGPSTVYKSTDGGASWAPVYEAQNEVNCLAANGPNVYAGAFHTSGGEGAVIYASQDEGGTWQEALTLHDRAMMLSASFDPGDSDLATLGGMHWKETGWEDGVVYGTRDGGLSWDLLFETSAPGQNAMVLAVLISPHNQDLMLATVRWDGPATYVYRSTDGGSSWAQVATVPDVNLASLVAHGSDPDVIYAGAGCMTQAWWGPCRVYRSGDQGATWDLVLPDGGGPVAFEPPSTVYALSGGQVWASASNGDAGSWSQVGGLWDGAQRLGIDLGVSPAALYAGLQASGVALSTDGGANWIDASNGMSALAAPRDIDITPSGSSIYVSTEGGRGGFRSDDDGSTWTQVMEGGSLAFEIRPDDPYSVYAGVGSCNGATIWHSVDGGASFDEEYTPDWFQPDCSGGDEQILAIEVADSFAEMVYAAGEAQPSGQDRQAVVVYTLNGGVTWHEALVGPQGSGFDTLAVNPLDSQEVWAGGRDWSSGPQAGVIYRTQDGSGTWQRVFYVHNNNVRSIVVDPANPDVLYAACDNAYDVYKSEDGGDTWTLIRSNNPPFNQPSGNKLAIDPNDHNRIYLGGWGYIAESGDGGATWTEWDAPINASTPPAEPRALAVDAGSPVQTLYAGFSGLWAHTRPVQVSGDRYVATTGDDNMNPCTDPAAPCLTVGHALYVANPGETIRVAAGTYVENQYVEEAVILEGGYSGPPGWTRDPGHYQTVLDGSGSQTIPGEWDGEYIYGPTVLRNGPQYEMWYSGKGMDGRVRQGRATGESTLWTKSPENPLLEGSEAFVRLESGLYRMWYNRPDGQCIGYAWSNDGLAWTEEPDPALCAPHDGSWDSDGVSDPNVVLDGGGTYWMFYEGMNWGAPQPVHIGCATGPDGLSWTRCAANPVLSPGSDPFEEAWVLDPAVLLEGGIFRMWYSGRDNNGVRSIGYADSPDGLTWTRYGANPVLQGAPGAWDENNVHNHAVWFHGTGYDLWYSSNGRIGQASSADGLSWTKYPDPVLEPGWYGEMGLPVVRFQGNVAGARLDGFSVTGGNGWSGGVQVFGPDVTIAGCNIHHNVAADPTGGGGVAVENPGSSAAIVDCQIHENDAADGGGVMFWNGASGSIQGTTITGNTTRSGPGAGIEVHGGGAVSVEDSVVQANHSAGSGGGINVQDGCTLVVTASEVRNNTAQGWGGGIDAGAASLNLVDVTVNDNQSLDGEGGGLVLWNGTTASITGGGVAGNWAQHGAGGINVGEGSTLTLHTVAINGNTSRWGTALRLHNGSVVTGNRVWLQGNTSTDQSIAGFQVENGSLLDLTNALVTGNGGGTGDVSGGSTLTLTHVTLADNTRADGWAGVHVSGDAGAVVRNSILAWNGNADLWCDDPGTCLVEYSDLFHPWPGAGNISTNPRFVDRASGDYHLAGGSPCIEAADPAYSPGDDLDGETRPYDGDGDGTPSPDMGADEYTGPPTPIEPLTDLYVDGSAQIAGTGTPADPYATVGEALANAFAGDAIHVAAGTYVENNAVSNDVSIRGGYSGVPDWVWDPQAYVTVLDGSANPSVPGDWDGAQIRYSMVLEDGGTYLMWYTGCGINAPCRIGMATSPDGIAWTKYAGGPVLDVGDGGAWDDSGLEAPFVVKDGPSSYKMWYSGFGGCAIGLATSPDGFHWSRHPGNPVLAPGSDPWNNNCVIHPSVVYEGGVYKMWMYAAGDDGSGTAPYVAYATSPDGISWTWHPANPLLARDWEMWLWRPYVVPTAAGRYDMWYSLWNNGGYIGHASSPNGVFWGRDGSPALSGTPGEWDDGFVSDPAVLLEGSQLRMWYDNGNALGGAESSDGYTWTKRPENPLLQPGYYGQQGAPVVHIYTPGKAAEGWANASLGWAKESGPEVGRGVRPSPPALGEVHDRALPAERTTVLLDSLTITGGTYWQGGGLLVGNAEATLRGVQVTGNHALGDGGGIAVDSGSFVQVYHSQIDQNIAERWAGGLSARGGSLLTMQDTLVRWNVALTGEGGGLAVFDQPTEAHLTRVAVLENQADGGGGISQTGNPGSLLVMNEVAVSRNTARWAAGLRPYHSSVIGDRVWVVDNVATEEACGGFNADNSDVSLTNALIAGNVGEAGCFHMGTLSLTNVTVADNIRSGGFGGIGVGGGGTGTVRNSILYFNSDGDLGCDPPEACTAEYSDVGIGQFLPGPGNFSADPEFVDRPGGDYHIQVWSPCIDRANPAYAPDHDIDGEGRPVDGDGDGNPLPDVGADEYPCSAHLWKMKLNWAYAARPGYVKLVDLGIVHDQYDLRAIGARVSGFWTLPDGTQVPQEVTTDYLGRFKFRYKGPWAPPGVYRFDVTDIRYDACGYDAGANETDPWREVSIPPP